MMNFDNDDTNPNFPNPINKFNGPPEDRLQHLTAELLRGDGHNTEEAYFTLAGNIAELISQNVSLEIPFIPSLDDNNQDSTWVTNKKMSVEEAIAAAYEQKQYGNTPHGRAIQRVQTEIIKHKARKESVEPSWGDLKAMVESCRQGEDIAFVVALIEYCSGKTVRDWGDIKKLKELGIAVLVKVLLSNASAREDSTIHADIRATVSGVDLDELYHVFKAHEGTGLTSGDLNSNQLLSSYYSIVNEQLVGNYSPPNAIPEVEQNQDSPTVMENSVVDPIVEMTRSGSTVISSSPSRTAKQKKGSAKQVDNQSSTESVESLDKTQYTDEGEVQRSPFIFHGG